jgi:hypothetical protein
MFFALFRRTIIYLAFTTAFIFNAAAQSGGTPQVNRHGLTAETALYANGSMLAIFFHEMGHMLISELKLPLAGPEEDVVDEFSALVLANAMKQSAEEQKYIFAGSLVGISLFWKIAAIDQKQRGVSTPFYDEHSPNERRFANILCVGIGADPLRFAPIATRSGFSDDRMQRCSRDYQRHEAAWDELITRYIKTEYRGTLGPIKIQNPRNAAYQDYAEQLRLFAPILEGLSKSIKLPRNIPVIAQECGVANAFFSPAAQRIIICYEMYEQVVSLFAKASAPSDDTRPAPQPGPGAASRALSGSWRCLAAGTQEQLVLSADGAFQSTVLTGAGYVQSWGRWSQSGNILTYNIASSNVQLPPVVTFSFAMPDKDTLQIGANFCRRTSG